MKMMYDVSALGELLIDFTPSGASTQNNPLFEQNPGGAPANVLVALSRLGKRGAFLGMVGNDQFGLFLRNTLQKENVETRGLKVSATINTTLAFVHLDFKGERFFSFYRNPGADLMLRPEDVDYMVIKDSKIFHFGSVSMSGDPAKSATIAAVKFAKENGVLVSYDPNYRPLLWKSQEEAQRVMKEVLPYTDVLKVSDEELQLLTGTSDHLEGASSLFKQGPQLIFITLGPQGCFFYCASGHERVPSFAVKAVDTTGAGDAFWGAVLYHLGAKTREELARMSVAEMREIVKFSCAAGALTTTKKGAIPGIATGEEIAAFIKERERGNGNEKD
jgi:fructokinase